MDQEISILSPLEKNTLYHQILLLVRQLQTPEQTTALILKEICYFLSEKKIESEEPSNASSTIKPVKASKIFRRVG